MVRRMGSGTRVLTNTGIHGSVWLGRSKSPRPGPNTSAPWCPWRARGGGSCGPGVWRAIGPRERGGSSPASFPLEPFRPPEASAHSCCVRLLGKPRHWQGFWRGEGSVSLCGRTGLGKQDQLSQRGSPLFSWDFRVPSHWAEGKHVSRSLCLWTSTEEPRG